MLELVSKTWTLVVDWLDRRLNVRAFVGPFLDKVRTGGGKV